MTTSVFETLYPIINEPVIEHPSFHIYHTQDELPRGIQYSSIYEVTPGRVSGDTSQLAQVGNFEAVTPYALISDVLPNQYRGIYFEDSKLPIQHPSSYEVLPSNYELDLEQITYTDGTVLNPQAAGLALQRAMTEYELTRQSAEDYNKQGNIEMANRLKERMNQLAEDFAEIRQQEIQGELDVIRNQHLVKQRQADLQASVELPDVLLQLEQSEREITRLIELSQQRGTDTTSLEISRGIAQLQISGLREHLLGGHAGELPDIITHAKNISSQLNNQLNTEFSGLYRGVKTEEPDIIKMLKIKPKKKINSDADDDKTDPDMDFEINLPSSQKKKKKKMKMPKLERVGEEKNDDPFFYSKMSKSQLIELAKMKGIKGLSNKNKGDLIKMLKRNPN